MQYLLAIVQLFRELARAQSLSDLLEIIRRRFPLGGGGVVYHYGCPNSSRTTKLQLQKKLYK